MRPRPSRLDDAQRLEALRHCGLLDTLPEEAFDRLTRLVSRSLGAPIAVLTLVRADGQFLKSSTGIPEPWAATRATPFSFSLCRYVVMTGGPVIVESTHEHPSLRESDDSAPELPRCAAYLGAPIASPDGWVLGALAAIDTKPRQWSAAEVALVGDLAAIAASDIEARTRITALEGEQVRLTEALQRAMRSRDDTLGIVSHDLRNPIHTIFMSASFLQEILPDDAVVARDHARVMKRSAERANRLIGDLLDITRLERGQLPLERRLYVAAELVREAAEHAQLAASHREVSLLVGELDEMLVIRADRDRMLQALGNLVANALKFTMPGGTVRVAVTEEGGHARFTVSDTGSGIPPEHRERLFDRFWQANRTDKRGVGLGLSIVKGIVEGHGGEVHVESTVGVGSTFAVLLPVADTREPVRGHEARLPPFGGGAAIRDATPDMRA